MSTIDQTDSPALYACGEDAHKIVVTLLREMNDAEWGAIDRAGQEILAAVDRQQTPRVIMDLSALNYMGSAMVALLLRIWKKVQAADGTMVFVNQDDQVYQVLKVAGLTNVWTICDSIDDAARELGITETTGQNISPVLAIAAVVAALIAGGMFGIILSGNTAVDRRILASLQSLSGLVGVVLGFWAARVSGGVWKGLSLLSAAAAAGLLAGGALSFRL